MEDIIAVLIICLTVTLFFLTVVWSVHITMTRQFKSIYGWATYSKFKQEFNKYQWKGNKDVIKGNKFDTAIISGTYEFDGKGMIINNPISYYLCERYVNRYVKKNLIIKQKVKW